MNEIKVAGLDTTTIQSRFDHLYNTLMKMNGISTRLGLTTIIDHSFLNHHWYSKA